ncbi:hypothetical protein [Aeromonas hydrophila]|uniref:hypothetical protein n=1 Tax=Aeromonas hydrophila TaxID=644 RepID=UPI00191CE2C3|nr:hypothetical protein [Aeromonas hydrophila]MBL0575186.1 hypothetical protein [Aeromonas hydrophila]
MSYENQMMLLGKLHVDRIKNIQLYQGISDVEFKVFSQWGQDGIIQYLINRIPMSNKVFIEFGVENYRESNTRFLMMNDNWSGLVIDGSQENIDFIQSEGLYWKYDINAVKSFITRDNIDRLIKSNLPGRDADLLSIDIDGNDYWVWEAIHYINPSIVICEYNSVFGNGAKITVPYREDFYRTQAHHSNLYFGASLSALISLAERKGYVFFGATSAGNDAFFIRKDHAHYVVQELEYARYVYSKARESRGQDGALTYLRDAQRIACIEEMEVWDLDTSATVKISSLLAQGRIIYE